MNRPDPDKYALLTEDIVEKKVGNVIYSICSEQHKTAAVKGEVPWRQ